MSGTVLGSGHIKKEDFALMEQRGVDKSKTYNGSDADKCFGE